MRPTTRSQGGVLIDGLSAATRARRARLAAASASLTSGQQTRKIEKSSKSVSVAEEKSETQVNAKTPRAKKMNFLNGEHPGGQNPGGQNPGGGILPGLNPPGNGDLLPQPNIGDWRNLLRALVSNTSDFLPEFSDKDHEDPEIFLRACEDTFRLNNIEPHLRVRQASRSLKDDAARWWAVYKGLNMTWFKFCELIRQKYASPTVLMRLRAKLYGQSQTDKEGTSLFLEQRE